MGDTARVGSTSPHLPHPLGCAVVSATLSQKRIRLLHLHQCLNDENNLQFSLHFDWNHSSAPGLSLISRVAFWGEVSVEGSFVGGPVRWAWGQGRRQVLRPNFPFLCPRIGIVETQGHPGISSGWFRPGHRFSSPPKRLQLADFPDCSWFFCSSCLLAAFAQRICWAELRIP